MSRIAPQVINYPKGECRMNFPRTIAGWFTVLFFIVFALDAFGLYGNETVFGILAIGVALFTLIGK